MILSAVHGSQHTWYYRWKPEGASHLLALLLRHLEDASFMHADDLAD